MPSFPRRSFPRRSSRRYAAAAIPDEWQLPMARRPRENAKRFRHYATGYARIMSRRHFISIQPCSGERLHRERVHYQHSVSVTQSPDAYTSDISSLCRASCLCLLRASPYPRHTYLPSAHAPTLGTRPYPRHTGGVGQAPASTACGSGRLGIRPRGHSAAACHQLEPFRVPSAAPRNIRRSGSWRGHRAGGW